MRSVTKAFPDLWARNASERNPQRCSNMHACLFIIVLVLVSIVGCEYESASGGIDAGKRPAQVIPDGRYEIGAVVEGKDGRDEYRLSLKDAVVSDERIRINVTLQHLDGGTGYHSGMYYAKRNATYLLDTFGKTYKYLDTAGIWRDGGRTQEGNSYSGWFIFQAPLADTNELVLNHFDFPPLKFQLAGVPTIPTKAPAPNMELTSTISATPSVTSTAAVVPKVFASDTVLAGEPGLPNIYLYSRETDVKLGDPVLLELSVVGSILQDPMKVQLILRVPSAWVINGEGFALGCTSQCNGVYDIDPGDNRSVPITIQPNQEGTFMVGGNVEWLSKIDDALRGGRSFNIPVVVRSPDADRADARPPVQDNQGGGGGCNVSLVPNAPVSAGWMLLGLVLPSLMFAARKRSR